MLAAEIMGFYITDLSADTVTAKKNTRQRSRQAKATPSKNRVRNFFSASRSRIGNFTSQPVETHRENEITPTIIVSGISLFLSEDPIGELGGLNVYRFLGNDPLDYIDAYGLACSWAVGRCVRNVGNIAMPDEVTIDGKVVKIPRWVSEAVNVSVPDHHDVKVESYSGENCSGKVEESMVRGFFADNFTDSLLQYAAFLITFGRVDGYVPGGVKDSALTAGSCSMSCVKKERFDKVKQRITTSKASRYHLTRYNCQIWATEQLAP